MANRKFEHAKRDDNADPITGSPGAHPIEAGAGAAAGGFAAGAVLGAVGGPVGAAAGAVVGGVLGGLAGKEIGEQIDPTSQDAFWRENYRNQPYVERDAGPSMKIE
jgi:phage tail tape-measure protein